MIRPYSWILYIELWFILQKRFIFHRILYIPKHSSKTFGKKTFVTHCHSRESGESKGEGRGEEEENPFGGIKLRYVRYLILTRIPYDTG